ncbi:hypothetical protein AVEN_77085-1 [Araneus ventricosus]|uniref:Uncharacterized protein n=1 Tax=Araneus ventricosus TaxID=182803 RepID=A0A4Y2LC20_ARAVE|nr:hypothetical protein AVEN_77085-1 [Araneus ventricosus]
MNMRTRIKDRSLRLTFFFLREIAGRFSSTFTEFLLHPEKDTDVLSSILCFGTNFNLQDLKYFKDQIYFLRRQTEDSDQKIARLRLTFFFFLGEVPVVFSSTLEFLSS